MASSDLYRKSESWQMFNRISPKYDFLNRVLSFGLDIHWRNKLIGMVPRKESLTALDLATGTADVLLALARAQKKTLKKGYGIDMAEQMLAIGRRKIEKTGLAGTLELRHGDACRIPFMDNYFDAVTISFGIRNVEDPQEVLREMFRTLKPGGTGLILEFSLPKNGLIRACHLFYLRHIVPLLGQLLAGNYAAYKYLNQTIEKFPYGAEFTGLMAGAGFTSVSATELLFGTATIYRGEKP